MSVKTPSRVKPQTEIFSKGYDPQRSEGAAVPPVFRTSTFIFKTAAEGKRAFEIAYGLDALKAGESPALIYTRVNNPNSEILEDKITAWDQARGGGPVLLGHGRHLQHLPDFPEARATPWCSPTRSTAGPSTCSATYCPPSTSAPSPSRPAAPGRRWSGLVAGDPTVKVIYIESPANPTNILSDIPAARELADQYSTAGRRILVIVDNTFMGPIFSKPLRTAPTSWSTRPPSSSAATRTSWRASPWAARHWWARSRSCAPSWGPIPIRTPPGSSTAPWAPCSCAWRNSRKAPCASWTSCEPPQGGRGGLPGQPGHGRPADGTVAPQCTGTGSVISFCVKGGEPEAFRVLDAMNHVKMAVSLGGIESLIEHPATMTHSDMTAEEKAHTGITDNMVRLSVGLEDTEDLIEDLRQALDTL